MLFPFIILLQLRWPTGSKWSQIFVFYAYVEIHQVKILVFDNYQMCPVPLDTSGSPLNCQLHKWSMRLCLFYLYICRSSLSVGTVCTRLHISIVGQFSFGILFRGIMPLMMWSLVHSETVSWQQIAGYTTGPLTDLSFELSTIGRTTSNFVEIFKTCLYLYFM